LSFLNQLTPRALARHGFGVPDPHRPAGLVHRNAPDGLAKMAVAQPGRFA